MHNGIGLISLYLTYSIFFHQKNLTYANTFSNELKTFLIQELVPSYFVYSACKSSNMETWHKLDRILDATLTNEVGRKVSISQGSALMRVSSSVFVEIPSLKTM